MARQYHHGDLKRSLLDAAVAFLADGRDFTMRELARRAKVTHNAPYRHFADKEALLAAIAEEGFEMLAADGARALAAAGGDPRAALRELGASYVFFAVEHPHHFRLMFGLPLANVQAAHPSLGLAAQKSFAQLTDAIEAIRAGGLLRADRDPRGLAIIAWALVHGLASLLVAGQLPGDVRAMAHLAIGDIANVFFEGVLAALPPAKAGASNP
ncbi:TetR/AcrR family transcriptional regulator [Pendulispora albinea]|uniref:TetR/AcrR family transcriptional regulator n=1 Tax=Pendulispora albinea TaxID=2741071 RepID=A0ABZ2MAN4_9BACT